MRELNWNNEDFENGEICLSNAIEVFRANKKLAGDWTDKAISYFANDEEKSLCNLAHCYYIKGLLLVDKDKKQSSLYFTESIKKHILGSRENLYRTHKFYKFVGVDIDNLESILNKIRLIHPSGFNDPMDCPIARDLNNGIPNIDLFKGLRVGCFGVVENTALNNKKEYYLDASKWSYYGDSHKGLCIEYDFSELEFCHQYALMKKIKYEEQYNPTQGIVGSGLLTKSIDYERENEWRIIWYDESLTTNDPKYINIKPLMITKIYLGYKCSKEIELYILQFKKMNPHIDIYKIRPSEDNFYRLSSNICSNF